MYHIGGDGEVVVEELRRPGLIGEDATNLGGSNKNCLRPFPLYLSFRLLLPCQVDFVAVDGKQYAILTFEAAN